MVKNVVEIRTDSEFHFFGYGEILHYIEVRIEEVGATVLVAALGRERAVGVHVCVYKGVDIKALAIPVDARLLPGCRSKPKRLCRNKARSRIRAASSKDGIRIEYCVGQCRPSKQRTRE